MLLLIFFFTVGVFYFLYRRCNWNNIKKKVQYFMSWWCILTHVLRFVY